jgi:hypothetical protein
VQDGIGFGESGVGARRTGKGRGRLSRDFVGPGSIGMAGGDVKGECGGLEELLVAVGALEREVSLVLLEMIVHSVLTLLCDATMLTNVESGRILFIGVGWHLGRGQMVWAAHQFLGGAKAPPCAPSQMCGGYIRRESYCLRRRNGGAALMAKETSLYPL